MMEDMGITQIGLYGAIFLIITLICFFLLSSPVETILTSFEGITSSVAQDELDSQFEITRLVMTMFWAIFISLPATWIIIKVLGSQQTMFGGGYRR